MFFIVIEIYIVVYRLRHWVSQAPVTDFAISQNPPLLAVYYHFLSFLHLFECASSSIDGVVYHRLLVKYYRNLEEEEILSKYYRKGGGKRRRATFSTELRQLRRRLFLATSLVITLITQKENYCYCYCYCYS